MLRATNSSQLSGLQRLGHVVVDSTREESEEACLPVALHRSGHESEDAADSEEALERGALGSRGIALGTTHIVQIPTHRVSASSHSGGFMLSPSTSIRSCSRGCETFLSSVFHTLQTSEIGDGAK